MTMNFLPAGALLPFQVLSPLKTCMTDTVVNVDSLAVSVAADLNLYDYFAYDGKKGGKPAALKREDKVDGLSGYERFDDGNDDQPASIHLTPMQTKILNGVHLGLLNKQIAHSLGITEATVKGHMTTLMRKLNVRNRTQVALAAEAMKL
jgi:DNA-binding CsgD family transcriptional regulator